MFTNLATNIKPKKKPQTRIYFQRSILTFYILKNSIITNSQGLDLQVLLSRITGRESSERKGKTSDHNEVHTSGRRNQREGQWRDKQLPGCSSKNDFLHYKPELGIAWSIQVLRAELSWLGPQCSCHIQAMAGSFPESTWLCLGHFRGSYGVHCMVQIVS